MFRTQPSKELLRVLHLEAVLFHLPALLQFQQDLLSLALLLLLPRKLSCPLRHGAVLLFPPCAARRFSHRVPGRLLLQELLNLLILRLHFVLSQVPPHLQCRSASCAR